MDKIKSEDITVEELKAALSDISNYALLQIIRERVKLNEVSLHDVANLVREHPECIAAKIWQKDDIREYDNDNDMTESQIDCASRMAGKALEECTDNDWGIIKESILYAIAKI